MQTIAKTAFLLLVLYIVSSCASTHKIDFESAYKFSRYSYHSARHHEIQDQGKDHLYTDLIASLEHEKVESIGRIAMKPEKKLDQISRSDSEVIASSDADELTARFRKLTREEKREIRKEIKAELKSMQNLVAKNAMDTEDIQKAYASADYTRLVIIIGGVGLILLILGAIFSGFLAFIGALAVVAAAVLFIIDQS